MVRHVGAPVPAPVEMDDLARRTRELETLHQLGQAIADALEPRRVLEGALEALVGMGWFQCGEAYLKGEDELLTVAVGLCPYETVHACPLRPQLLELVAAALERGGIEEREGWYLVPIGGDACLALSGGETSRHFLATVVDLVTASLNRSRLHDRLARKEAQRSRLLQALLTAQEEERGRISRDLHDQIGQALTAMLLGIDKERQGHDSAELRRLKQLASVTLADVRRIALDLRPSVLDELGLEAALRRYAREIKDRYGLEVGVLVRLPQRLTHEEEIVLYRVVQEAVTNVVRHAGIEEASVVITAHAKSVHLVVEDEGRGFDPDALVLAEQIGLMGMRERLELLGGSFRVESRPGEGCAVHARLPLRPSYAVTPRP